jgi:hypothetical protein
MTVSDASSEPSVLRDALKGEAEKHVTTLGAWRRPGRLVAGRQAPRAILFKSPRM